MMTLGYMSHDRANWTFIPSQNLPQVTEWVASSFQNETALLNILNSLHNTTGETINLSRQSGEFIRIIHGLESQKNVSISVKQGTTLPITATHTGMVALACNSDKEIVRIIKVLKSKKYKEGRDLSTSQALEDVALIRKQQFAPGYSLYMQDVGAICFPLKPAEGGLPFIVGVVGPADRIRRHKDSIIEQAKKAVSDNDAELAYPS